MHLFLSWTLVLLVGPGAMAKDSKKVAKAMAKPVELKAEVLDLKNPAEVLFHFQRSETLGAQVSRKFTDPAGTLVAEESVNYEKGQLKKLTLNHVQLQQSGFVEVTEESLNFSYTKDGKTKTSDEKRKGDLVSSDQIYAYINGHWSDLMAEKTIDIRFPVLDRLETVGFKFFKVEDADRNGIKCIVIKMKPSSFVIAALVDPILFYFHPTEMRPDGHKLLEVVGRTLPKKKDGNKWKDLDATLKFKYEF